MNLPVGAVVRFHQWHVCRAGEKQVLKHGDVMWGLATAVNMFVPIVVPDYVGRHGTSSSWSADEYDKWDVPAPSEWPTEVCKFMALRQLTEGD